jgi:hypothetical protein
MEQDQDHWHLDRRVPIALIIAIAVQTGGFIWWASDLNARVTHVERQIQMSAPQAERIIRVETKLEGIADSLNDLKALIRRERSEAR